MARILAVETATRACSAALLWDGECREILRLEDNRHAEILIPMAQQLLADAGGRFEDLDALAFGSGPGSFTGLRIGIAVTQGLAFGAGRPVVGVSSLLALANRAGGDHVLAAFDARMDQVYWNTYERVGDVMRARQPPRVSDPRQVRVEAEYPWLAVGNGCDAYREVLVKSVAASGGAELDFVTGVHPHAEEVVRIAEREFQAGRAVDPAQARPEYVRDQVVQRG